MVLTPTENDLEGKNNGTVTHMRLNVIRPVTEASEGSTDLQQLLIALLCTAVVAFAWFMLHHMIPQTRVAYIILTTSLLTVLSLLLLMVYS